MTVGERWAENDAKELDWAAKEIADLARAFVRLRERMQRIALSARQEAHRLRIGVLEADE